MRIICSDRIENNEINLFIIKCEDDLPQHFLPYNRDMFSAESIQNVLSVLEVTEKTRFDMEIRNIDSLNKIIEVINESKNIEFVLDISDNAIQQKELLNIMDKKLINKEDVKIKYQELSSEISLSQYNDMYMEMYKIIKEVEELDLSPLEQVMYVYDIVRSRIYKNDSQQYNKSRDLYEVINGDDIVCVGYSNMMQFILSELGHDINCVRFIYDNQNTGHIRNSIYIKDDKYNVDNVLFLDATSNRKLSVDDTSYLNNYTAFLVPYCMFHKPNSAEHFADFHYEILEYDCQTVKDIINNKTYITNEEHKDLLLHSLRTMYNRKTYTDNEIAIKMCNEDIDGLLQIYNELLKIYTMRISPEIFLECLYNVKYEQALLGKIDHILSLDEFEKIMIKNYGEDYFMTPSKRLLLCLLGIEIVDNRIILESKYNELQQKKLLKSKY